MADQFRRRRLMVDMEVDPIEVDEFASEEGLNSWLESQARMYGLTTLLAHADDGLIWGKFDGAWQLSHTPFPQFSPPLRLATLHGCRLFGPEAEVYLWRSETDRWQARLIRDRQVEVIPDQDDENPAGIDFNALEEAQILWGTEALASKNGFTLVADGQRNQHAPPLAGQNLKFAEDGRSRPLRLWVRHYLHLDRPAGTGPGGSGAAYIALSRLVALDIFELEVK